MTSAVALPGAHDEEVRTLVEQNRQLTQQVGAQQKQIDELRARLDHLEPAVTAEPSGPSPVETGRQIRVSGEAGLAFFHSGKNGNFPNSEFRVDEAKVFIEAPIWKNVYFFGGVDLVTRESSDEYFHIGELYVDVEKLFSAGKNNHLSLRAGRFNVPFGEEYLVRNVIDNPLITHSLADIWGIDEGVQIYGALGGLQYNLAVQNGGRKTLHDYDPDKAVTMRLAFDPAAHLHLSASAMRTGKLNVAYDGLSEIWFGNSFFRALGTPATTQTFSVELLELDVIEKWKTGQLKASVGWINFDDDSTATNNARHLRYYSLEAQQQLAGGLSGAVRFSKINADGGYPLAGQSKAWNYYSSPTTDLQRLSVGLNYRFAAPLVWKVEYSRENGRLLNGTKRGDGDIFSTLLGIKF